MTNILKAVCLAVYLVAVLATAKLMPESITTPAIYVALVLLGLHVLEAAAMFGFLRRQPGSLAGHLVQTLLFGFLYWGPLRRRGAAGAGRNV